MNEKELLLKIKKTIASELEINPDEIPDNAELNNFAKWDSLNHIKIMLALENEFNIELNEENIQRFVTIEKILNYLKK